MNTPPSELPRGQQSAQLLGFVRELDRNIALAGQVKNCSTPEQIIEIATSVGFALDKTELRIWSRELSAPNFPWAGKGNKWRRNFFIESSIENQ